MALPPGARVLTPRSAGGDPARSRSLTVPAPAKINLFLHVTGRRADGYHDLESLFVALDFGDTVTLARRDDGAIARSSDLPGVPAAAELAVRAAQALQRETASAYGVDIGVDKRIPQGAGLGGGSSDAASVLLALNRLWDLNLPRRAAAHRLLARRRRAVLRLRPPGDCARLGEQWGYDEINLNVGCPSERVQTGSFGACLMAEPALVADCVRAMRDAVAIPVTVKHRLGLDRNEDYGFVRDFVGTVAAAGCEVFVVHARNAGLKGLSPKENREVPPLRYEAVHRLKREFARLNLLSVAEADDQLVVALKERGLGQHDVGVPRDLAADRVDDDQQVELVDRRERFRGIGQRHHPWS